MTLDDMKQRLCAKKTNGPEEKSKRALQSKHTHNVNIDDGHILTKT